MSGEKRSLADEIELVVARWGMHAEGIRLLGEDVLPRVRALEAEVATLRAERDNARYEAAQEALGQRKQDLAQIKVFEDDNVRLRAERDRLRLALALMHTGPNDVDAPYSPLVYLVPVGKDGTMAKWLNENVPRMIESLGSGGATTVEGSKPDEAQGRASGSSPDAPGATTPAPSGAKESDEE